MPVLLVLTLVVAQLAIAGYALWTAGVAARAGARAGYVGGDAEAAARHSLPALLRRRRPRPGLGRGRGPGAGPGADSRDSRGARLPREQDWDAGDGVETVRRGGPGQPRAPGRHPRAGARRAGRAPAARHRLLADPRRRRRRGRRDGTGRRASPRGRPFAMPFRAGRADGSTSTSTAAAHRPPRAAVAAVRGGARARGELLGLGQEARDG